MSGVNMAGQACQQAIMDMKSKYAPLNNSLGNICQLEVCDGSKKHVSLFGKALIKTVYNLIKFCEFGLIASTYVNFIKYLWYVLTSKDL